MDKETLSIIRLTYNSKSTSKSIKIANRIAGQLNASPSKEDESCLVVETTKDAIGKKFCDLLDYVSRLKGTMVELDDELIGLRKFMEIIWCYSDHKDDNLYCWGVCRNMNHELDHVCCISGVLGEEEKNKYCFLGDSYGEVDYVIVKNENEALVDRDKLHDAFLKGTLLERKICKKYDLKLTKTKFNKLPEHIPVEYVTDNPFKQAVEDSDETSDLQETYDYLASKIGDEFEKRLFKFGDIFENKLRKIFEEFLGNKKQ